MIEHYTDVPVLGGVHRNRELEITERHLGLIPSNEETSSMRRIDQIRNIINDHVDIDGLLSVCGQTPLDFEPPPGRQAVSGERVRIGIARDAAFGFYYPDDLEALEQSGAELVTINTLKDTNLPEIEGLFIGGGFPETHMDALQANSALRHRIRDAISNGLPAYAECGGLMYLSRSLSWKGMRCEMVGVIPVISSCMSDRRVAVMSACETSRLPWPEAGPQVEFAAHEFHYSSLENITGPLTYALDVRRGTGIDGKHDGIVINNLVAGYSHLRDTRQHRWAHRFVDFVRRHGQLRQRRRFDSILGDLCQRGTADDIPSHPPPPSRSGYRPNKAGWTVLPCASRRLAIRMDQFITEWVLMITGWRVISISPRRTSMWWSPGRACCC